MDTQTLTIKLAAEVAEFISKIKGVESLVSGVAQRMRDSFSGLWATLGATVSVAGLGAFVKSSINAMDQLDELSQRYGISVKELSGLQLAFKQSGIEQDAMASSMGKLQRAMADGNRGLAAIGVGTRNADGSLRGTSAVLLDVADKFAGLQDGAGKTALAVEIFGKSGADMVPLLNSGSDGIKDMISTAERLGLVLEDEVAAKAGNFNDTLELLGMGAQGVGRGIAARLLPTLQSLAENFLTSMTNGDRLAKTAEFLANILKGLYIGALAVVEVFSTLGKTFGAVIGAFFEAAKGNFKEAWAILKEGGADISKGWTETAAQISAAWSGAGGDTVAALAAAGGAAKKHAPDLKAIEENAKAAAKALEELRKNDLKVGELRNKMVGEATKAEAEYQAALDARNFDAAWEADQKHLATVEARIKAGRTTLEQLQFENSLLAMNTTEREVATAMRELERQGVVAGTEAWTKYAAAIQTAVVDREAAKKATDFWQSIETTAKGVFTDVANDGTSAFERIGKTLKASVLDVLWQITGRQWLISVGTAVGVPGAAMASTATGGSSLLGTASSLSSAYDTLSNGVSNAVSAGFDKLATSGFGQKIGLSDSIDFGTGYEQVATNSTGATLGQYAGMAGNALAGYGLQKAISGGYKTGESGLVDAITVAASAYFGPIAGVAAGAFNRAFGRKLTDQGLQGQFGGEAGFTGENYQFLKGGWFRSDKTKTSAIDADMQAGLANQFKALQVQAALMATVLGDTGQSVADFTSSIKLSFNGLTEAQIGEKLTETFTGLANDMASAVLGGSALAKEGEATSQTLQRLANSLTTVNGSFGVLGFGLKAVSLAGADAASDFIDLVGGLEAFTAATAGYYANYYTEAERQSKATEQLTAQLAALGQPLPATRESFRALVESAEAAGNTALLAGLLQLQDEFAALVPATSAAAAAVANLSDTLASSYSDAYAEYADSVRSARALAAEQAQAYASLLDDARSFLGGISTTVREWLDARNATTGNPTANLASSQAAFQRQLALAQGGDRDALGSITQYADRLISAGDQRLGYLQGQQLIASVMSQVKGLPDQVSAEQLIVKAINATGSATVGAVDGLASNALTTELTVTARSEILKTISYVADTDRLPDDLKALALGTTSDLRKTISYVVGADLPQDLKQLALQGTTHASKTIRLIAESILNPEMQTLALQGNQTVGKAIDLVVRSALAPEMQILALRGSDAVQRTINVAVASATLSDEQRILAMRGSDAVARVIQLAATNLLDTEDQRLALINSGSVSRSIELAAGRMDTAALSVLSAQSDLVRRTVEAAGGDLTADQRLLLDGSTTLAKMIEVGVDGTAINAFLQTLKSLPPITIPFVGTFNVGSVLEHASTGGNADLSRLASINTYVNTLDWVSNKVGSTQALYATAQAYGVSQADIAAATGYNLADIRALFDAASIPAFATGAAFGGGIVSRPTMFPMGLMGEKDPEAIMPLANIGGSLGVRYAGPDFSQFGRGMEAMAAEIRRLNDKNDRLEALFRASVVNSADAADTLRNIKNNGLEVFNTPTDPLHTQAVAP